MNKTKKCESSTITKTSGGGVCPFSQYSDNDYSFYFTGDVTRASSKCPLEVSTTAWTKSSVADTVLGTDLELPP